MNCLPVTLPENKETFAERKGRVAKRRPLFQFIYKRLCAIKIVR